MDFHKKKKANIKKICVLIKDHWEKEEKKEQKNKDKEEADRIKALKVNDFDGYIKLLERAKIDRLEEILNQT